MRTVAGKKSEQRAFQDQTARVTALLGGTLGQKLRNKPMPLDAEFKAQAKLRRERWAAASKLSKAILAPLHKIIQADTEAMQAVTALRKLTRPRRPKVVRPRIKRPRIKSHVQTGSILVFRGLPYDVTWAAGSGGGGKVETTIGRGLADQSAGTFSAEADSLSNGGSAWGGAGLVRWCGNSPTVAAVPAPKA